MLTTDVPITLGLNELNCHDVWFRAFDLGITLTLSSLAEARIAVRTMPEKYL